ncbi:class I SAM-dependent methyltransferase [Candidatus Parcubacteria bacterium]|nr:MAG: class I SAM-dependent methyltransferase [Candidatus Parcubacteria bacterium]
MSLVRIKDLNDIRHESGFAYIAFTGMLQLSLHRAPSAAIVMEDGVPLPGPANAPYEEIRRVGRGRYSFWHDYVYFSTSDNSDPLINGRVYQIKFVEEKRLFRFPRWMAHLRDRIMDVCISQRRASLPVNFIPPSSAPESIKNDIEYAVRTAQNLIRQLPNGRQDLVGKTILEIGPGINFGSALLWACLGARVMVADRFLAPWHDEYHSRFYTSLRNWISQNMPYADLSPLDSVLSDGYTEESISRYPTPVERLAGIPDECVDIVFSNAVLEHIADPEAAFRQMYRVSKPGALGIHQVDFRDHRDMEKPLEFLLMSDEEFALEFERRHGECGNRYRPWEYKRLFEAVGFDVVSFEPNIYAADDYLDQFIPRLRSTEVSKYKNVEKAMLREVSGLYILRRATM